jgi:hypothetical protein
VEIAPVNPVSPVAARNQETTSAGISDMEDLFTTEAIETTLGGPYGIHRGTVQGLRGVASVRVSFPTIEGEDNFVVVPQDNPIFAFFLAQEAAAKLGCELGDVPIVVQTVGGEGDLSRAVEVIREAAATHPREAAKKQPILDSNKVKPSDEPKGEKIVADELAPRETNAKEADSVTVQTVQIGDKTYKLTPIDEEEDGKTPEEIVDELEGDKDDDKESKTADRRHIVRSEQSADGVVRSEEIVEETGESAEQTEQPTEEEQVGQPQAEEPTAEEEPQYTEHAFASVEDEKERKLLTAMKIADDAIELGIIDKKAKMVYIADLEEKSLESLSAVQQTFALVKSAGLQKSKLDLSGVGLRRVPRLAHNKPDNHTLNGTLTSEMGTDPDFLWGV